MLANFWTYQTDLPPGVGTPNFSPVHFSWVALVLLTVVLIVFWYRRQPDGRQQTVQRVIAVLLMIGDPLRWTWAAMIGHYSVVEMLPLHLCTLSVVIEITAVFSKRRVFKEFAYACGLPGALAAILTPDWGAYPLLSFQYLQSIMTHSLLILLPAIWIWGDGFRPDFRQLPRCLALLLGMAGIGGLVNHFIGSNYMFLRYAPKDTPLELFETWFGNPGYLLPLLGLLLLIWLIAYTPWLVLAHQSTPSPGQQRASDDRGLPGN